MWYTNFISYSAHKIKYPSALILFSDEFTLSIENPESIHSFLKQASHTVEENTQVPPCGRIFVIKQDSPFLLQKGFSFLKDEGRNLNLGKDVFPGTPDLHVEKWIPSC